MIKKAEKPLYLIIAGVIWFIVAVGFGFFGLIGFLTTSLQQGFRETMCGSSGCTNFDFFFSFLWLIGMVSVIYLLPIAAVIYIIRKRTGKLK